MTIESAPDDPLLDDAIGRVRCGETAECEIVVRQLERPLRA